MDNRNINLTLEGKNDFDLAMKLACANKKTVGYSVDKEKNILILYWTESEKMIPLPYKMDCNEVIEFVWGWLNKTDPKDLEPDHDGKNYKGFNIYNEYWGYVNNDWKTFIAISPIWAMHGK